MREDNVGDILTFTRSNMKEFRPLGDILYSSRQVNNIHLNDTNA
jgi:hypothetical protein